MYNIAVTGSFASGKSFVLSCIDSMGYKVFSCDDYVRKLYQDKAMQELVVGAIDELDKFDKKKLAEIIYSNAKSRTKLEQLIHPKVRLAIKEFEQKNSKEDFVFTEVPLLFESGFDEYFPYNICVFCSEQTRILRAQKRGIKDIKIFEKIKKIQLSQEEKKKRADFLIDSEDEEGKIKNNVNEIINTILSK